MIGVKYGPLAAVAMMAIMNAAQHSGPRATGGAVFIPKRTKPKRRLKHRKGRRK